MSEKNPYYNDENARNKLRMKICQVLASNCRHPHGVDCVAESWNGIPCPIIEKVIDASPGCNVTAEDWYMVLFS